MAYSYIDYVGTGTLGPFQYYMQMLPETTEPSSSQLVVYRNGVALTHATDYTINTNTKQVTLVSPAQPVLLPSEVLRIARSTRKNGRYVDYVDSTNVTSNLLDLDSDQIFFLAQEAIDIQADAMVRNTSGQWEGRGYRVSNIAAGVNGTDAVNVNQLQAATSGALPASLTGQGVATYTGDGTTTVYSLPAAISTITAADDVAVYVNGIRQRPTTDYTVASGNITMIPAPASGDTILLSWPEGAISGLITANSVNTASLQDDAVTVAKIDEGLSGQFIKTVGAAVQWVTPVATDISNFDTAVRLNRLDQMAAPTANISANSNKITNLATGVAGTDAANVDNISNYKWHHSVAVAHDGTGSNVDRTFIITNVPFTVGTFTGSIRAIRPGPPATDFTIPFTVSIPDVNFVSSTTIGLTHVHSFTPGGENHGYRISWDIPINNRLDIRIERTSGSSTILSATMPVTIFRRA